MPDSVDFPTPPSLTRAVVELAVQHDLDRGLPRLENEAAFLLYERRERRRVGLGRLRSLGHGDLLEAYLTAAQQAMALGTALVSGVDVPAAMAELTRLTDLIREVEGCADFLSYPTRAGLVAMSTGYTVYVAAADQLGLAVVIGPDDTITVIPLPGMVAGRAFARGLAAWYAYRQADGQDARTTLAEATQWCWDECLQAVCDRLPADSRVTIVPVGVCALLPLHAVLQAVEHVTITMAPNLRVASANRAEGSTIGPTVAAFAPQAGRSDGALARLPWSAQEVAAVIAGRAGSSCRVDAAATRQALLSAIGHYDRVHLAGHAQASISFPLASHLILADGTVTIQDVLSELPDATSDLGVLSCCVGALGGAPVPTGGVTFAGVLLATCFRRVIGSLWRLRDDYTALVTAKIHSLIDEGVDSALALRQAQLFLRSAPGLDVHRFAKAAGIDDRWMDQSRADVLSWGPLVHFG